ncbi:polyribonucleotide nucleotidyltransferase [Calditerrivibrio nitroreducens]|uniref:Polyribonucleotide nucleotidyltransferase n=1 Tax=Calditerrivibrio nitroreducens (strain DSM 19672 / NBRC 101217 / Yu37-1) TaxID=768670 RepID=E4TJD6_CALNY|nr:polyribonucleotide nucleotidyltransferase [Calditerrivibrio nitroreducens]ADR19203.1 polyribonucleotide nucleotidyltransferase [Calditerrivibrio nitroreducens DSM 19672]
MEKNIKSYEIRLGSNAEPIILETGWKAKQTNGSIWAKHGETVVLVTAVMSKKVPEDIDFFPLTVNYIEKFYSVGKIPGGFLKRESKPSDKETLIARLIDRPLRPIFPDGFRNEVQIVATVVSSDQKNSPDVLSINAASAALMISDIPFNGPVGAVRVGKLNGEYIINPDAELFDQLVMNIVLAGTEDAIVMVEAGLKNVSEEEVVEAFEKGHQAIREIIAVQKKMREELGLPKAEYKDFSVPADILEKVYAECKQSLFDAVMTKGKKEKYDAIERVKDEYFEKLKTELGEAFDQVESLYSEAYHEVEKKIFREITLENKIRVDGRRYDEIRPIDIEVGLLPRAHGSALFTRGETQALVSTTLGTKMDSQLVDDIEGNSSKRFMLHYNFPPFSVGEVGRMGAPGRREVGHGALAERALSFVIPDESDFPYTIRVVSEILESNGSSSMATVCGGCLSLMDAGVPVKDMVAGIAMGLIYEKGRYAILSDIMGIEDHLGDMDFKVAGTKDGITALQMDIKIEGLSMDLVREALAAARVGRLHILSKMQEVLASPRPDLSPYAPRFVTINVDPEKVGLIIGPAGKNIKAIIEETGVSIDILDGGVVNIFASSKDSIDSAISMIEAILGELTIDKVYKGKVKKLMDYGAFVEIAPGIEALLHVSQYSFEKVDDLSKYLKIGDVVEVKYLGKDERGRHKISRKATLEKITQSE